MSVKFIRDLFLPTAKEVPADASIASHIYSLRAGLVNQLAAGLYSWLPLGLMVLRNIEKIIKEEMKAINSQEILMPIVQPADLWKQSGRYDDYGQEMARFEDRGSRELLLAPTHEEVATSIFGQKIVSYKELPQNWYHIQWKFRDEIRPRFGVMRSREFLMKDGYSFDLDKESALLTYHKMYLAYYKIFTRMGLRCVPALTDDTGPIGGSMSHEFHILTKTGEDKICYDARFINLLSEQVVGLIEKGEKPYGVMANMHNSSDMNVETANSIEVGHIFYFGQKYSKAMRASVVDAENNVRFVHMGSYGIGVSRLIGAIIESSHDDKGIIWPHAVAPFKLGVIDLTGDESVRADICEYFGNVNTLYDNSDDSAGVKFNRMDLIGLPWQIIIGKTWKSSGMVELKNRSSGEKFLLAPNRALDLIIGF